MRGFERIVVAILAICVEYVNGNAASKAAKTTNDIELSSGKLAVAGAVATSFGVIAMHPIDTVKTLQQSNAGKGLNILAACKKIVKV